MKQLKTVVPIAFAVIAAATLTTCQQPLDLYETVQETVDAAQPGKSYSLTVSSAGGGLVSPSGTTSVEAGANTSISAEPNTDCEFVEWLVVSGTATVADSTAAATTVNLSDGDAEVRAVFSATLSVTAGTGGSVSPQGDTPDVRIGEAVDITATADGGYAFVQWEKTSGIGASIQDVGAADTTVTLTEGPATIHATFSDTLHVLTIESAAGGTTTPATGSHNVAVGTSQHIEAIPDPGGHGFVQWTVTAGASNIDIDTSADPANIEQDVTLTGDATIRPVFEAITHELTIDLGSGGASSSGGGTLSYPYESEISAVASSGYEFTRWYVISGGGNITIDVGTNSQTVTLTGDATIRAEFQQVFHTLSFASSTGGTASGAGTFSYPYETTIRAHEENGYEAIGWSIVEGDGLIQINPSVNQQTVTLSGDVTLRPTFELIEHTLTVTSGPHGTAYIVGGDSTITYPFEAEVRAEDDQHYDFEGWTEVSGESNISIDPGTANQTVTLSGDAEIRATFGPTDYQLQLNGTTHELNEEGYILQGLQLTPSSPASVTYGTSQQIEVVDPDYVLVYWMSSGGAQVSNTGLNPTSVSMTGAGTVTALVEELRTPSNLSGYFDPGNFVSDPHFQISWNDNATTEDGYRIRVTNIDGGYASTAENLPANTTETPLYPMYMQDINYQSGDTLRVEVASFVTQSSHTRYQWANPITVSE